MCNKGAKDCAIEIRTVVVLVFNSLYNLSCTYYVFAVFLFCSSYCAFKKKKLFELNDLNLITLMEHPFLIHYGYRCITIDYSYDVQMAFNAGK